MGLIYGVFELCEWDNWCIYYLMYMSKFSYQFQTHVFGYWATAQLCSVRWLSATAKSNSNIDTAIAPYLYIDLQL